MMKNMNTICIILAIVLVVIIVRAVMNKGKLWGEQENYQYFMAMPAPRIGTVTTTTCTGTCQAGQRWDTGRCECVDM